MLHECRLLCRSSSLGSAVHVVQIDVRHTMDGSARHSVLLLKAQGFAARLECTGIPSASVRLLLQPKAKAFVAGSLVWRTDERSPFSYIKHTRSSNPFLLRGLVTTCRFAASSRPVRKKTFVLPLPELRHNEWAGYALFEHIRFECLSDMHCAGEQRMRCAQWKCAES